MSNLFIIIAFLILWTIVIVQGFILQTFTKEVEEFSKKIISINPNESEE